MIRGAGGAKAKGWLAIYEVWRVTLQIKKIAREVCFVGLKTFILGLIWKSAPCPGPVCIVGLGLAVRGSAGLYSLGFRVSGFRFRV